MALPLPAGNKIDGGVSSKPATQTVRAEEWNQLVAAVSELQGLASVPTYVIGSRPTPSAAWAQRQIAVTEPDEPTLLQVCLPNSSGGYEWVTLQQSS